MNHKAMAPLFAPRRASDPLEAFNRAERRLKPFFEIGILRSEDVHVAARLGRRTRILEPDVLLALALAVRAPRHAHTCINLETIQVDDLLAAEASHDDESLLGTDAKLELPQDRDTWRRMVCGATALVRTPDDERITPFVLDGAWLYVARFWAYQNTIVSQVHGWRGQRLSWCRDDAGLLKAIDHLFRPPNGQLDGEHELNRQRLAAVRTLSQAFTVITGGPGMGKTWTVRNIIALLCLNEYARTQGHEPPRIALAAPTGKAAARIRESLLKDLDGTFKSSLKHCVSDDTAQAVLNLIHGLQASTLHRLLGTQRRTPSRFRHHRANPLPYDVVIVDEVSMVDFTMMAKLLDAIASAQDGRVTRLILLGDRDQLASVEAGTVLADLCGPIHADTVRVSKGWARDIPIIRGLELMRLATQTAQLELVEEQTDMASQVTQFNRTYRFDEQSGIGRFARACVRTRFSATEAVDALVDQGASDARLMAAVDGDEEAFWADVEIQIREGYQAFVDLVNTDWRTNPKQYPTRHIYWRRCLEMFDQFRILCAHRAGRRGVSGFNRRVLNVLAQSEVNPNGLKVRGTFWRGRPVLITRNDYAVKRYNGNIGLIFPDPDARGQWVAVFAGTDELPSSAAVEHADWSWSDSDLNGERQWVEPLSVSRLPPHQTVFAMTIHKSQGSEFEHVMMVLPDSEMASRILTRELVYTGITRAKRQVTILASRTLLEQTLLNRVQRSGCLKEKLWGGTRHLIP